MDPRLYEIVAAMATNQPAIATATFQDVLGDRIDQSVAEYARNYQYNVQNKEVGADA